MKFLKRVFTIIIVLIIVVAVLGFFGKNKKDKEREARREGSSSRVEQMIREETSKEEFSKAESSKEESSSEKPEKEPTEEPEEEPAEEESAEESQASGIRPDVKEAIDAYEAFIDEYCEFITVYSEDPTNAELIAEYLEFVVKLEEEERKIDALDKDLTEEEDVYYTEVLLRCSEKLNEAALKLGE